LLEDILKNSREELEKRVEERTSDLRQVNVNLQHVNQKLEEFVYAASHDLQEPLRKLITYIGMLSAQEKDSLSDSGRQTMSKIIKAVERMQLLIKDLSDLTETTRSRDLFSDVDLDAILKEVLEEELKEYEDHVVEIRAEKLPVIRAVPVQMQQLLANLVSNALKFSAKAQQPLITITYQLFKTGRFPSEGFAADSSYIELVVSDNGIGFDEEYQDKIFQLFQRLHNRSEYPGTGIGLSICRNIAENHNGFITAKGKPGEGASFYVYLKID
jgi:light-regulated signal transduction histidine kinase (bacteriophytochrome)